jgi:hypothetical protein
MLDGGADRGIREVDWWVGLPEGGTVDKTNWPQWTRRVCS